MAMTIEIKTGRGWRVWLDGALSDENWSMDIAQPSIDPPHPDMEWIVRTENLKFGDSTIEYIGFEDDPDGEAWGTDIDGTRLGPTALWVKFDCMPQPYWFRVKWFYYLREDDPHVRIQLTSGEWEDMNETNMYILAEEGE